MDARRHKEKTPAAGEAQGFTVNQGPTATQEILPPPGRLPPRVDSATAEILARLLAGEKLTAQDSLRHASTMRLAATVERLSREFCWTIHSERRAVGCADGRVARRVARYFLEPSQREIAASLPAFARWSNAVRRARAARRQLAADAFAKAVRLNAMRDAGQADLFEGDE